MPEYTKKQIWCQANYIAYRANSPRLSFSALLNVAATSLIGGISFLFLNVQIVAVVEAVFHHVIGSLLLIIDLTPRH
jgi:hypothetical protein